MPDFRDYEVTNIEQILKNQGLTNYTIIEKYNDKVEKGYFIKQNPAAGTKIGKNTKIEITVSKGPEVKLVNVPNVEGQKEAKGKEVLEKLNLVVTVNYEVTNDKNKDGIILKQSDYDSQRTEGTPITLTVGKYEEKKAENEVINIAGLGLKSGMKVDEAIAMLLSHDLSYEIDGVGDIVESFTKEIKKGETVRIKAKNSEKPDNTDKPEVNNSNNNANNGNNNGNNQ